MREGRQPFVSPPGAKAPSQSQAEHGIPGNTLLNTVFLSPKVAKVIISCTAFRVR